MELPRVSAGWRAHFHDAGIDLERRHNRDDETGQAREDLSETDYAPRSRRAGASTRLCPRLAISAQRGHPGDEPWHENGLYERYLDVADLRIGDGDEGDYSEADDPDGKESGGYARAIGDDSGE